MLSQFFILSSRGDTIAFRDYRGDVVKGTAEIFYRKATSWKGSQAPPIFNVEGIHFIHICRNGLYFVCTTKFNVSATFVLELLGRLSGLFKDYCGVLNEESIRLNFTLIYELLDEVLDAGYPQILATESLKCHVHNDPILVSPPQKDSTSSKNPSRVTSLPGSAANKPVAVSLEQKRVQKNEIFLDLLERLTVVIAANGSVLRSEVAGCIQMKSFLIGSPEVRVGLNEALAIGREESGQVSLDNCGFHECVNLEEFERDRVLSIIPPDGETTLMNYRVTGDFQSSVPFVVYPFIEDGETLRSSVDVTLKLRCNLPSNVHATGVVVRIPVPKSTTKNAFVSYELGSGQTSEYKASEKLVYWRMKKVASGAENQAKFKLAVSEKGKTTRKEVGPLSIDFEIPMFSCSGLIVRFLRVFERGGASSPSRWVRYITHSDSYVVRI